MRKIVQSYSRNNSLTIKLVIEKKKIEKRVREMFLTLILEGKKIKKEMESRLIVRDGMSPFYSAA